ncbi:MAG TPA: tetratricopeptide repeat protein [Thermoanaerobaculia bacterium]|nr:tetratricopeptide repeat protein [Thermoanaerobaculia bacterium]
MMVERHYDDEALIAMLEADRVDSDGHLPSCTVCNEKVESYRLISTALRDKDVWDTRAVLSKPVPETIATLRAFADRMSAEDTAAAQILPELLAGPREEWMPRLREHPEWRTAGVVRGLVDEMRRVVSIMPPDALTMTLLATEIADHLNQGSPSTLNRLRGLAWRDHAYALFYTGAFTDALAATERAESMLDNAPVDEYDRARIRVISALARRAQEDLDGATSAIRFSSDTFARFRDFSQLAAARVAEVHILFSRGELDAARVILHDLDTRIAQDGDPNLHARVLGNLGYCYWRLGRIDEALLHHEMAASLLETIGIPTEAARVGWNVASILAAAGRVADARVRLHGLHARFSELGMSSEAALVNLDIAEILIASGDFTGVQAICRAAMSSFETAGIPYTARALTALAYIREAAQQKTVTTAHVKHVRDYLRKLPHEEKLLFAPLPGAHLAYSR